jgi:hypothetical protein
VGVVGNVKQAGLASDAPLMIYMPYSQGPSFLLSFMAIAVRTDGDPLSMVNESPSLDEFTDCQPCSPLWRFQNAVPIDFGLLGS